MTTNQEDDPALRDTNWTLKRLCACGAAPPAALWVQQWWYHHNSLCPSHCFSTVLRWRLQLLQPTPPHSHQNHQYKETTRGGRTNTQPSTLRPERNTSTIFGTQRRTRLLLDVRKTSRPSPNWSSSALGSTSTSFLHGVRSLSHGIFVEEESTLSEQLSKPIAGS